MKRLALLGLICLLASSASAQVNPQVHMGAPPLAESIEPRPLEAVVPVIYPTLKWWGDLRVRQQTEKTGTQDSRIQSRLRARFGVRAQVAPELKTEISLATSKSNRSNNQTMGDNAEPGSVRRFVGLDLAFAEWVPAAGLKLDIGRFSQLHYRPGGSQVLLDDDLSLEGAGLAIEYPLSEDWKIFANTGSALIRENYETYYLEDLTDNVLNWAQLNVQWKSPETTVTVGGGFYNFVGFQGQRFADLAPGATPDGNSSELDGSDVLVKNNFVPRQGYVEVTHLVGAYQTSVFYEMVTNDETRDPHQATYLGFGLGRGKWDVQLASARIQSDAVPAPFTHSDFCDGTTDCEGTQIAFRYRMARNFLIKTTWFDNLLEMSTNKVAYRKMNLDFVATF